MHTFDTLARSERPEETRLILFQQCLRGLAHLHENGIMHRDIKTANLAVVSYAPLRAMIMDFGSATSSATSTDHYKGTIVFLAPEVISLKRHERGAPPYDRSVDVWSLGLVGYTLFTKRDNRFWWHKEKVINASIHAEIVKELSPPSPGTISGLVSRMLEWHSDRRPTAVEALADSVWPEELDSSLLAIEPGLGNPESKRLRT
jgi:serine/threonine protein kinase